MPIAQFNKNELPQSFSTATGFYKVLHVDASICMINMTCPHRGGPLTHATDQGEYLICPWHKKKCRKINLQKMQLPVITIEDLVLVVIDAKPMKLFRSNHHE